MKRSHFCMMVFIGAVLEVVIITIMILHIKHPVFPVLFPVLVGVWGFIAGIAISKYKELTNG